MTGRETLVRPEGAVAEAVPPAPRGHVFVLSGALALVGAVTTGLTLAFPDRLTGTDVMNGSAVGTALVMLTVAIPLLLLAMRSAGGGSVRAQTVWLGALAYLLYNAFLLVFATPFNQWFLLYVATFSLALFSVIALALSIDGEAMAAEFPTVPVRGIAVYLWTLVALNALAWLRVVVPALGAEDPTSFLDGTGLATNPIYVQDLAFWLPMVAVSAWALWRRRTWAYGVVGAYLVYGVVESVGVSVDQWLGHRADPASDIATLGGSILFAVMAVVALVPLWCFYRRRSDQTSPGRGALSESSVTAGPSRP